MLQVQILPLHYNIVYMLTMAQDMQP